ncbi:MAG: GtrA family protein [Dysgonamonadaceae bacterium]
MIFLYKLLKFGIVGISGMLIDFSITWICKDRLRINKYIANTIGFLLSATSNYILNRIWTFQSHNKQITREYVSFLFISLIGLGLNNLVIYILHGKFNLNFYKSKIVATGIVVIWNFSANYFFTFNQN